jgi:hypothetical protein
MDLYHIKDEEQINKRKADWGEEDKKIKKVLCIETGKIYESITAASIATGIDTGNICKCCKNERKKAGGYQWEYYD